MLSTAAEAAEHGPLKVVASFTIVADMVRAVGGEWVEVKTLVGPDSDAHAFQPTPGDARSVAQADLLVANGLGFEGWLGRLTKAAGYKGPVVLASAGITPRQMVENGRTETDPHAWQDLANGRRYLATIAEALVAADSAHAEGYRANLRREDENLAQLDAWVRAELASVPADKRKVITTHNAFGYFAAAYGITFLAPQGLSSEAEVTPRDLARLVKQVRQTGIKAIFLENMSDPRLVEQLAKEAGAKVGGKLYVDALSPADGPAPSYPTMFRNNVTELRDGMAKN